MKNPLLGATKSGLKCLQDKDDNLQAHMKRQVNYEKLYKGSI